MSDIIILEGTNTAGLYKEFKAQYLRGEISHEGDKKSLYNAATSFDRQDTHFATLLEYDKRFDFYMTELSKGAFIRKPSIVEDLKQVAAIKGMDCVRKINQAIATCEETHGTAPTPPKGLMDKASNPPQTNIKKDRGMELG